jgi:hypothetical protein
MTKIRDRRLYVLDVVDYQGSGSAPQERVFGNSMHVRVIPVKPRGLVGGKCNVVLESLAGIDKGLDDLIGVASGGRGASGFPGRSGS